MNRTYRNFLQRANAVFLLGASGFGFANDIRGVFLGEGPVGTIVRIAPHTGIGLIEAHGLAFILGALLVSNRASPMWHRTAAATHFLLGGANIACWPVFAAADMLMVGYVTTVLHVAFFGLQSWAAAGSAPARPAAAA